MNVAIPLFPGVEELDAVGPFEVFGLAKADGVSVRMVAHDGARSVQGVHGVEFSGLSGFSGTEDVIVVPGGAWLTGGNTGVRRAATEGSLPSALAAHFQRGATVSSVCTGAFLLEKAGLLEDVAAATHHLAAEDLRTRGVRVENARVVDAGRIVTAGGITSGIDLALWLLDREYGPGVAVRIAHILEYEWNRDVVKSFRLAAPDARK